MIIFEKNGQKYCFYNNKVMIYTDKVAKDERLKTELTKSRFTDSYVRPKSKPVMRYVDRKTGRPIFIPLEECCYTDQMLEKERRRKLAALLRKLEED